MPKIRSLFCLVDIKKRSSEFFYSVFLIIVNVLMCVCVCVFLMRKHGHVRNNLISRKRDNKMILYCIALYCLVLYCTVLYCTVLYCIVLYCIVLYCIVFIV